MSRHEGKTIILPSFERIGTKRPPVIESNPPPPQTMEQLAKKFCASVKYYDRYVEKLELKRRGLNLVPATYIDPDTGEEYIEMITQREADARWALGYFYDEIMTEDIPTYDELMIDSEEEDASDYDSEEDWKNV